METNRRYNGVAIAGAAVSVTLAGELIERVVIVLFGVAATPVMSAAASSLSGISVKDTRSFAEVAALTAAELDPASDILADASYRQRAVSVLVRRAIEKAITDVRI